LLGTAFAWANFLKAKATKLQQGTYLTTPLKMIILYFLFADFELTTMIFNMDMTSSKMDDYDNFITLDGI
jgi:hypothetical protein